MLIYWLLFAGVALPSLLVADQKTQADRGVRAGLLVAVAAIALLIGFRFEVGADWFAYTWMNDFVVNRSLEAALERRISEPGYLVINGLSALLGGGIWLTNLLCGTIFGIGLYRLAQTQEQPWLVVLVAIPYMAIVVAMGYSRQGVALGVLMMGIADFLGSKSIWRLAAYVALAALFHRSAIIVFPIVALAAPRTPLTKIIIASVLSVALYVVFLEADTNRLIANYIAARYSSQGALIRVLMSFSAALLLFTARRTLAFDPAEYQLWRNFAVASLLTLVLLAVSPSSTAVDRIAIYLLPLQAIVLARVPNRLLREGTGRLAVVLYAFIVLFVWLNYAVHAKYWLPYEFYPLFEEKRP